MAQEKDRLRMHRGNEPNSPEAIQSDIDHTRREMDETLDALGNKLSPRRYMGRMRRNFSEKVQDMKRSVRNALPHRDEVGGRIQEGYARTQETAGRIARRTQESTGRIVREYPLVLGAGVFAAGALIGYFIPRSRKEEELMGESSRRMKELARERGRTLMDKGRDAAQAGLHAAKSELQDNNRSEENPDDEFRSDTTPGLQHSGGL